MLVLSRQKSEEILIGDDIRVMVVEVSGNRVKLGITAPQFMQVVRAELLGRVHDETRLAKPSQVNLKRHQEND